ncbi:mechanosensitive ion channel [Deferribacter autotrophicus]|uniref:Mechanosensitive ion channel n=1 Tax=Deferribacter autotrophicus TaxID=500465 RepID=A0A5A8F6Q3_9BACT|nr:mechanosensitive ion channel family protein [Deferribacter autotrophicus]KAA0258519.1 mechanosensitive ion channel [Deferribacter autotrophicus]
MFDINWLKSHYSDILIIAFIVIIFFFFKLIISKFTKRFNLNKSIGRVLNYTFIIIIIEFTKPKIALSPLLDTVSIFIEVSLIIFIFYNLIINVYIKDYLIHYKGKQIKHILIDIIKLVFLTIFILTILRTVFKVDLITILTPSAILTAIIGLSMKDTIGNLISGLIIQIEKPFDVGDWIKIDDYVGQITEINWRYTKLKTLDNIFLIIPNNNISSGNLLNYNRPEKEMRILLEIGVSYDTPPDKLKSVVKKVLLSSIHVDKSKDVNVYLKRYNDFSIDYDIAFWIKEYKFTREARDEIYSALWYEFKLAGIEIPFPIRTIINKEPTQIESKIDKNLVSDFKKLEIFNTLSETTIENLIRFSNIHTYPENFIIIEENEQGESMFIILDGLVEVFKDNKKLSELKSGDFFGEMSLLTGERRSATVVTKSECKIVEISRPVFKVFLEKDKKLMDAVNKIFQQRIADLKKNRITSKDIKEIEKNLFAKFKKLFNLN